MSEFEDKLNSILSSPEEMKKIMGVARSISDSLGSGERTSPPSEANSRSITPSLGDLDPKMLKLMSSLMGEYKSQSNDKTALLKAMKPYLKPERQSALDKAADIVKMAHLAKIALSELGGGDKN